MLLGFRSNLDSWSRRVCGLTCRFTPATTTPNSSLSLNNSSRRGSWRKMNKTSSPTLSELLEASYSHFYEYIYLNDLSATFHFLLRRQPILHWTKVCYGWDEDGLSSSPHQLQVDEIGWNKVGFQQRRPVHAELSWDASQHWKEITSRIYWCRKLK